MTPEDAISYIENSLYNMNLPEVREAWQTLKAAVLGTTTNIARDATLPVQCSCGSVDIRKVIDGSRRLFYKCKCGNTAPVA